MINIGLIGYGYWGPNIAKNAFASSKINLTAICDQKQERVNQAKKTYISGVKYSLDYHTLLCDPDIHAIALAVETESHYSIGREVLLADKHLFIEKPITANTIQAQELIDLAHSRKRVLHVDHIMLYHPVVRRIKELYDSGEIGDLIYVDVSRMNLGKIKNDVNSMWDLAVHDLAIIDYLCGGKIPLKIQTMGEKRFSSQELLTYLTLKYDGFIAHIKSSWISPLKERRIIIAGEKKMIVFDDMKGIEKLCIYDKGFDRIDVVQNMEYPDYAVRIRTGDLFIPNIEGEDALKNSIEAFAHSIENGSPSISDGAQALRVVGILEAANRSLNNED